MDHRLRWQDHLLLVVRRRFLLVQGPHAAQLPHRLPPGGGHRHGAPGGLPPAGARTLLALLARRHAGCKALAAASVPCFPSPPWPGADAAGSAVDASSSHSASLGAVPCCACCARWTAPSSSSLDSGCGCLSTTTPQQVRSSTANRQAMCVASCLACTPSSLLVPCPARHSICPAPFLVQPAAGDACCRLSAAAASSPPTAPSPSPPSPMPPPAAAFSWLRGSRPTGCNRMRCTKRPWRVRRCSAHLMRKG